MLLEDTSRFLSRLFSSYPLDSGLSCEVRSLATDGTPTQRWFGLKSGQLNRAAEYAVGMRDAYNVYAGVLARQGRGDNDFQVPFAGWLWCDVDAGNGGAAGVAELVRACRLSNGDPLPTPEMIVSSGSGGAHLYWRLQELLPLPDKDAVKMLKSILQRICTAVGGSVPGPHADTSCANASRILRVPGTLNHKFDPANPVQLIVNAAPPIPLDYWLYHLPFEAIKKKLFQPATPQPLTACRCVAPGLQRWAESGYSEGRRHKDLAGAAKFLKRDCELDDQRGYDLFLTKASRSPGTRALTDDELHNLWEWA